jgi:hypothetical protein
MLDTCYVQGATCNVLSATCTVRRAQCDVHSATCTVRRATSVSLGNSGLPFRPGLGRRLSWFQAQSGVERIVLGIRHGCEGPE